MRVSMRFQRSVINIFSQRHYTNIMCLLLERTKPKIAHVKNFLSKFYLRFENTTFVGGT